MKKLVYLIIAGALVLGACTSTPSAVENETAAENNETENAKVEIIHDTLEEFENNMQGDFLLLDVRTPEEYEEGNIEGSILIPVSNLEERLDEIAEYKDLPVLVYCRSGNRSVTASEILINNGFTDVHNLLSGYNGWKAYKSN